MSVYLGSYGQVELRRISDAATKFSTVNPSDINVGKRRFSFDFDSGFLNSGDQIQIQTTNGVLLNFVDASGWVVNAKQSSGNWYINIDELGGIRLYDTFDKALAGTPGEAIILNDIVTDISISVHVSNLVPNLLAQCTYFELNTNREVIDITALGDEFRTQYSSLISGSGNFKAYWEYLPAFADQASAENAHYFLQLAIRTEIGSKFGARLYLKVRNEGDSATSVDDEIWYDIEGIITQAGVNFSVDSAVEISADFITTGTIKLLSKTIPSNKVLQESSDDILLEQNPTQALLQEDVL
jgi:hypothetical protein